MDPVLNPQQPREESTMGEQDRRAAPRHEPARDRIRIAWMDGHLLRRADARLIDLSSGGAAGVLAGPRPPRGPIWIGLEGTPHSEWMIADVVRVAPLVGPGWQAGLRFVRPCATRLFRKAVWGLAPEGEEKPAGGSPGQETAACSYWSVR